MKKIKLSKKQQEEINNKWIRKNGAGIFDFKNRDIILYDGGLFAVEKEVKKCFRSRFVRIKKGPHKGMLMQQSMPWLPKREYNSYKATLWFEELDETINYLKRMKKLLNELGYKTTYNFKNIKRK